MKKEFLIDRQGKQFVLYAGLLDLAHDKGLVSIQTEIVSVTASLAMFKAVVTMTSEKDGARTFEGHGDATPENVGRNIAPHYIRMAETRAKARALRDALNIGAAALEELGDDDEPAAGQHRPQQRAPAQQRPTPIDMDDVETQGNAEDSFAGMPVQRAPTPISRPPSTGDAATPAQVRAIYAIGRNQLGLAEDDVRRESFKRFNRPPEELGKRDASQFIDSLKQATG